MISVTADKLPNNHSTEFNGIPIIIEWPKGCVRVGKHDNGESWKMDMRCDYGYIPSTVDADEDDHVDVYIGPNKDSAYAYVLEQMKNGQFDEFKVMLGFDSLEAAEKMYLEHMPEESLGEITEVPFEEFLATATHTMPEAKQHEEEIHEERAEKHGEKRQAADDKLSLIDAFVKLYKHEYEYFDHVADEAHDQLAEKLQEAGIRAIVTYRAKKPRKLKGKLLKRNKTRNYQSFQDIYDDIVDMAGVRVALYLPADREAVSQIIEQQFTTMRQPKNFPEDSAPVEPLGYIATHYLVRLKPETLHKEEYQYADTNVEIQVASVLMHAWAEVTHDLLYKPDPSKGTLTPEEAAMIGDLNRVVQEGEGLLEKLQKSVQDRTHEDLRFELAAALTKLAKRLETQSKGHAVRRITASDVKVVVAGGDYEAMAQHMARLNWNDAGNGVWSEPDHPQEQIQVSPNGWQHKAWGATKGSGSGLHELQAYLGKAGMGDAKTHNDPKPHVSYLRAKLALWKAHNKSI